MMERIGVQAGCGCCSSSFSMISTPDRRTDRNGRRHCRTSLWRSTAFQRQLAGKGGGPEPQALSCGYYSLFAAKQVAMASISSRSGESRPSIL
jgi:hypothetical protein